MLRARAMRRPIREMPRCRYCLTRRRVYVLKSHIRLLLLSALVRACQYSIVCSGGVCAQYFDGELESFLAGALDGFRR